MKRITLMMALAALALPAAAKGPTLTPHPYFDDGSTLSWSTTLADAQAAARRGGRAILVVFAKEPCGNCRALVERVLPSEAFKARAAAFAVGLAAEANNPEKEVQDILWANLPGAAMLPFVGFLTYDLKWIAGFEGYKDGAEFLQFLDAAEKSPLSDAPEATRKKLAPLAERAAKAAGAGDFRTVLKAAADGASYLGRCPEREQIDVAVKAARAWAVEQLSGAAKIAFDGGDIAQSRTMLAAVKKHFGREPEYADAEKGLKALAVLERFAKLAAVPPEMRVKAAAGFKDTRWEAVVLGKDPLPPDGDTAGN